MIAVRPKDCRASEHAAIKKAPRLISEEPLIAFMKKPLVDACVVTAAVKAPIELIGLAVRIAMDGIVPRRVFIVPIQANP